MNKKPLFIVIFAMFLMSTAAPATAEQIWIYKKDGSQSCGLMPGDSIDGAKNQLEKAGVKVLEARKQGDGKMHIQMCGADSGQVNQFKIEKIDLTKAISLGYQLQK